MYFNRIFQNTNKTQDLLSKDSPKKYHFATNSGSVVIGFPFRISLNLRDSEREYNAISMFQCNSECPENHSIIFTYYFVEIFLYPHPSIMMMNDVRFLFATNKYQIPHVHMPKPMAIVNILKTNRLRTSVWVSM